MIDLYRIRDRLEEWWRYPQPTRAQKQLLGQYTDVIDTEFQVEEVTDLTEQLGRMLSFNGTVWLDEVEYDEETNEEEI